MIDGIHYSKEIENAVIGACLIEPHAVGRIYGTIKAEMFYSEDAQKVFSSVISMYSESIPIDILTANDFLMKAEIKTSEPAPYLMVRYTKSVVSTAHLEYHALVVRNMWQKRELERITHAGIDVNDDVRANVYELNKQLNEVLGTDVKKDWQDMTDLMFGLMKHQEDIRSGKKTLVTSGLRKVDEINGGFSEGDMIVIGARPGVGKSAFLSLLATEMAAKGKHVGIISLEMNNNQIAGRLASFGTDIDFRSIYNDLFSDENQKDFFHQTVTNKLINLPIFVSDKTKVDVSEIRAKAAKLKHSRGCDCLMIDYLQLVESEETKFGNREQEVAKISRGIKLMAMEMKIPVIVLVQLNRDVTKRSAKDRYPKLSDIRESGSLEQDADVVLMLHRDWSMGIDKDETGNSTEREADLLGVKWRNGSPFHVKLDFEPRTMKFGERRGDIPAGFRPVKLPYSDEKDDQPF